MVSACRPELRHQAGRSAATAPATTAGGSPCLARAGPPAVRLLPCVPLAPRKFGGWQGRATIADEPPPTFRCRWRHHPGANFARTTPSRVELRQSPRGRRPRVGATHDTRRSLVTACWPNARIERRGEVRPDMVSRRRSSTGHGVGGVAFARPQREKPAGPAFVLLRTLGGPNGPSMTPRTSRWRRPLQRPSLETPFRPSRDESISVLDDSPVLQGSDGCSKRRRFAFRHLRSRCSSSVVAAAFVTFTLAGWPSRLSESVPPERMLFGHRALERPS
jgi:hypothetical protein